MSAEARPVPDRSDAHSPAAAAFAVCRRDLLVVWRRRSDLLMPVVFFGVVVSVFPLSLGAEPNLLARISPGVIWVAALLATVMSLENLFRNDFENGTLEQMVLAGVPLAVLVAGKMVAHWLGAAVPLLLLAPLLGYALAMDPTTLAVMLLTLVLGTPVLTGIGAAGAALTVSLRRGGFLVAILVLPLYVPVLVFGAGAVDASRVGLPVAAHLYLLASLAVLTMSLSPLGVALALKVNIET